MKKNQKKKIDFRFKSTKTCFNIVPNHFLNFFIIKTSQDFPLLGQG
jgi:hypothetical protein